MQEPEPAPQFHVTENYSDAHVEEAVEEPAVPPRSEPSVRYVAPETEWRGAAEDRGAGERGAGERGPLLSSATSAAVDSAFNALAHTVLVQNARTLEDLVREMLRPMLKTWLDDNLPGLVERLVRPRSSASHAGAEPPVKCVSADLNASRAFERGSKPERLVRQHRRLFLVARRWSQ